MRELPPIPGAEPEYPTVVVRGEFFDWRFRVKNGELQCQDAHRGSEETWIFLTAGSLEVPYFIKGAEREKLERFIAEQTGVDQQRTSLDSLDQLVGEISLWQQKQFPTATPHSTATHLHKEVLELRDEIDLGGDLAKRDNHHLDEELADVFHMLIAVANACGVNLLWATRRKFEKNQKRVWGKPDADGVVEHVAEGCEDAAPARADVVDQDVPRPRLYIAGPMTGMPDYNYPAFRAEAKRWRDAGWDVVDPSESHEGRTDLPYEAYVEYDMAQLPTCDAIVMLPGWNGKGARGSVWEYHVAKSLGLTVFSAEGEVVPAEQHGRTRTAMPAMLELSPTPPPPGPIITGITAYCDEPVHGPMLPDDPQERKQQPICAGVLDYFPLALAEVARVSKTGNDQHNPGQPLHWARGKSTDHPDCIIRHLTDRGLLDSDGMRHTAKLAWRGLALLEEEMEQVLGKGLPRGARKAND